MESVPSLYLCSNPDFSCKSIILHSPLSSGLRILDPKLNYTPKTDFFQNIEMIPFVNCPIMIIHGVDDEVLPIEHSKMLVGKSIGLIMIWWAKDCSHEDILQKKGKEFYLNVKKFIKSIKNSKSCNANMHSYSFSRTYQEFYKQYQEEKPIISIKNLKKKIV